jgi:hypothetical protein
MVVLIAFFSLGMLSALNYAFQEDCSDFANSGWTVPEDGQVENWFLSTTTHAGGEAPELMLNWDPQFNGTARMVSPAIDLTGLTNVHVSFKHFVDWYQSSFSIGVATRSSETDSWTVAWQQTVSANVGPAVVDFALPADDISATFQFSFFFTGDSQLIDYWYMDDMAVYTYNNVDAAVNSIVSLDPQYTSGTSLTPQAVIANQGLSASTFNAICTINENGTQVYTNTVPVTLDAGATQTVSFSNFTIPTSNTYYEVVVTVAQDGDESTDNNEASTQFNTYDGDRQNVIVETVTGTWFAGCVGAAMGIEDLFAMDLPIAPIQYHVDGSNGQTDDYTNEDFYDRLNAYGVTTLPAAIFDGSIIQLGGSPTVNQYSVYRPLFDQRAAVKSPFSIEMIGGTNGTNYRGEVTVHKNAPLSPDYTYSLMFAVVETNIDYAWQTMDHLSFVCRGLYPTTSGSILSFTTSDDQTVRITVNPGTDWVIENCDFVGFVQCNETHEIMQGFRLPVGEMGDTYPAPGNLTATADGNVVTLTWDVLPDTAPLTGFKIYRNSAIIASPNDGTLRTFQDTPAQAGTYTYYIVANYNGYLSAHSLDAVVNTLDNGPSTNVPMVTKFDGNHPNPFNPVTTIEYSLKDVGKVSIQVFDARGRLVKTLVNDNQTPGSYKIDWNGTDNNNAKLGSGVYFTRMQAPNYNSIQKMIMLK